MRNKQMDALLPGVRGQLLAALFRQPEEWRYLSELAALLRTQPSSLQRELAAMVDAGILDNRQDGNRSYFRPQRNSPIFAELHGLVQKTAGIIPTIQDALAPVESEIDCAFIFGSVARSQERAGSDIDLLIVGRTGLADVAPGLRRAERALGREINVVNYSPKEFRQKVSNRDHFLSAVLRKPKRFLIGSERDLGRIAA